jgi:RNA polymerase sigma-70 factor (ECF subfamily)
MADPKDFVPFYREEAEAVLLFLARRTLDGEVAVELTAETFAQAWRGWSRVRVDSREEMRAWLFTIARRQLGRFLQRGRAQRTAVRRFGIQMPNVHEDDLSAIEDAAHLGDARLGLAGELERLSEEQRDALQLRVVEEMPYAEVARRLGVSEPAARARVSRGLRTLQRSLSVAQLGDAA